MGAELAEQIAKEVKSLGVEATAQRLLAKYPSFTVLEKSLKNAFVSYCFYKAGMKFPPIQSPKGFADCPYGVKYYEEAIEVAKKDV